MESEDDIFRSQTLRGLNWPDMQHCQMFLRKQSSCISVKWTQILNLCAWLTSGIVIPIDSAKKWPPFIRKTNYSQVDISSL